MEQIMVLINLTSYVLNKYTVIYCDISNLIKNKLDCVI